MLDKKCDEKVAKLADLFREERAKGGVGFKVHPDYDSKMYEGVHKAKSTEQAIIAVYCDDDPEEYCKLVNGKCAIEEYIDRLSDRLSQ